jgi:hypothetical protein
MRGHEGTMDTAWPLVTAEDWCGEYQPGYIDRTSMPAEARARAQPQHKERAQH